MPSLKKVREAAGVTQSDLATLAGVSQPTMARVEAGGRGLRAPARLRIIRALELSREDVRRIPELTYEDDEDVSKAHHPSRVEPEPEVELTPWQRDVGVYR